jgi:dienelactone hydrolase
MRKILFFLLCFSVLSSSAQLMEYSEAESIAQKSSPLARKIATTLLENFSTGNFENASTYFSPELSKKLSPKKLENTWAQIKGMYGRYDSISKFCYRIKAEGIEYHQEFVTEKEALDLVLYLDENELLSGLRMVPAIDKGEWTAPPYVNSSLFKTEYVLIGDEMPLYGAHTSPLKQSKAVAVVMVHGSGPNDMNEQLGPNQLFKDLAYGLASKGISSLRYNKRSFDYPGATGKKMLDISIDDIVVNDAVKAIEEARYLGYTKVILLGHSLGGHMAPKIARKANVEGVIIMAGNASRLEDIILPQLEHIMKNDSTSSLTSFQYNVLKTQVENVKNGDYDASTSPQLLPLGLPGKFWLSLRNYEPVKLARKQAIPYLILNGERDYQVPPSEAKKWKKGSKNKQSKIIVYPHLNHMFFAGEGICIPGEYQKEAHLEETVLKDISKWINSLT